jgi:hypothetical protein
MSKRLSIKVSTQKSRLKAVAGKRKTTLSPLMLGAERETVAPASCYELGRDLFDKPGNLGASKEGDRSINKRRMRSFGRQ